MKVAKGIPEMRRLASERKGELVGFVPTMGALHAGHLSLIAAARRRAEFVVTSVFVNPLQFGPGEDLHRYPRDEEGDLRALEAAGVDAVFLPSAREMYPDGAEVTVSVGRLGTILEGARRPGHFDGVATVVTKLLHIVDPDVVVFGQKDAQQVAVIRRLIADLDLRTEVIVEPTIREPDGLALSSRNVYLDPAERKRAAKLYEGLQAAEATLAGHGSPADAERAVEEVLSAAGGIEIDYVAAVDPATFEAAGDDGPVLVVLAAGIGGTRLIDNVMVDRGTRTETGVS